MMTLDRPDIEQLWWNCKDSLRHAGYHVAELNMTSTQKVSQEKNHHSKWVVLSVAHAADYYLRIFLKEMEPGCPFLKKPEDGPSVSKTIKYLKDNHWDAMQDSRKTIIKVIKEVCGTRNKIMHRITPKDLTEAVSVAAWAFFGLLRSVRVEYAIMSDTIVDQSPPIETELVDLVMSAKHEAFTNYVVTSLAESYDPGKLDICPLCGTLSVLEGSCEVCFQGISTTECSRCGEQCYVPDDSNLAHDFELDVCPSCGAEL